MKYGNNKKNGWGTRVCHLVEKYDVKKRGSKVNKLLIQAKKLAFFCFLWYTVLVGL